MGGQRQRGAVIMSAAKAPWIVSVPIPGSPAGPEAASGHCPAPVR